MLSLSISVFENLLLFFLQRKKTVKTLLRQLESIKETVEAVQSCELPRTLLLLAAPN